MSLRSLHLPALLFPLGLAACGVGSRILGSVGSPEQATARFVNATVTPLDLAQGGVVNAGNGNIAPGAAIACFAVPDLLTPGITVRQAGTTTDLAGVGTASGSFDVAAGTVQVRLVSIGPVVTDLGSFVLAPDRSYTIVSTSATAPILVPDC